MLATGRGRKQSPPEQHQGTDPMTEYDWKRDHTHQARAPKETPDDDDHIRPVRE